MGLLQMLAHARQDLVTVELDRAALISLTRMHIDDGRAALEQLDDSSIDTQLSLRDNDGD